MNRDVAAGEISAARVTVAYLNREMIRTIAEIVHVHGEADFVTPAELGLTREMRVIAGDDQSIDFCPLEANAGRRIAVAEHVVF